MKRIVKSSSPKELTQWLERQKKLAQEQKLPKGQTLNCRYKQLDTDIKIIVKQRLLEDQGYLCCYTGIRITEKKSHIEHFKPQSKFYDNHEDVDYNNLFAAYPGKEYEEKHGACPYGAHARTSWYNDDLFISPVSPQCETAFFFNSEGEIYAESNNMIAQVTIDHLNLKDKALTEMRKEAIYEFLYESGVSLKQAETLLEKIYDRDSKGRFRAFCFVLKQACEEYIRLKKKAQIRNKAIQAQSKKLKKS